MKKVLISILAVAAMFAAVSCAQSVEDKAKEFCEKAINAKSYEEYKQVDDEIDEWAKTLSDEDQKKVEEVLELYKKQMKNTRKALR